jgi:hypothetical protein
MLHNFKLIDPDKVTDYEQSDAQLQMFLLFAIFVAGKTAKIMAPKTHNFIKGCHLWKDECRYLTPFQTIILMISCDILRDELERQKIGKYNVLQRCLKELVTANLDLKTCTVEQLESVYGIGLKTSRFFVMHSRRNQRYAALDTHILRWLRDMGYPDIPQKTPSSSKSYRRIEGIYLAQAELRGEDPTEMDLKIWRHYSKGNKLPWPMLTQMKKRTRRFNSGYLPGNW